MYCCGNTFIFCGHLDIRYLLYNVICYYRVSPKRANISYILKYFAPEEIMPLLSLLPEEGVAPVVEVPPLGHPLHLPVRWVCSKYVLSLPSTYNFDEVGEFSGGRSLYSGHRKELGSSQFTMKFQHSDSGIFFFWVINIIWIYPFPSNEHCIDHLTMEYQ